MTPEDASPETTETLLAEVDARLRLLEAARPKSLDGFAIPSISKLPFNALIYREALLWRTVLEAKYNQITDLMPSFVELCELSGETQSNLG